MTPYHPLLRHSAVLKLIAEQLLPTHISRRNSLCAFSRSFSCAYVPANAVLYRSLDIRLAVQVASTHYSERKLPLLLRTFSSSPHLAALVEYVKTGLVDFENVMKVVYACTSLHTLHLNFGLKDLNLGFIDLAHMHTLPALPAHIQRLSISCSSAYVASWRHDFLSNLLASAGVTALTLSTDEETAKHVLQRVAPQLHSLQLNLNSGIDQVAWLSTMGSFSDVFTSLKHLRVQDFWPECAEQVPLQRVAPNLQRITVEYIEFASLEILLQCLVDSTWCPSLRELPQILEIQVESRAESEPLTGELCPAPLQQKWASAKATSHQRRTWVEPRVQFDCLLKRIYEAVARHNKWISEDEKLFGTPGNRALPSNLADPNF